MPHVRAIHKAKAIEAGIITAEDINKTTVFNAPEMSTETIRILFNAGWVSTEKVTKEGEGYYILPILKSWFYPDLIKDLKDKGVPYEIYPE